MKSLRLTNWSSVPFIFNCSAMTHLDIDIVSEAEAEGGVPTWDRRRQASPPQPLFPANLRNNLGV